MYYRFDRFALHPASRLLRRDQVKLDVPRRVFDCLVYLIEHRERAVGRDELIEAVWKRSNVSDNQLAHAIATARYLLDDTGSTQHFIRTVRSFGYHWIGAVEITSGLAEEDAPMIADAEEQLDLAEPEVESEVTALPLGETLDQEDLAEPEVESVASAAEPIVPVSGPSSDQAPLETSSAAVVQTALMQQPVVWRTWRLSAGIVLLLGLLVIVWMSRPAVEEQTVAATAARGANGIWVAPAQVPDDSEAWARVGLMALVAEGLRRQGADVVPVRNALPRFREDHVNGTPQQLLRELDATMLVVPQARRADRNWVVTLITYTREGSSTRMAGSDVDLLAAGRVATQRLGLRLGYTGMPREGSIEEAFEQIRQLTRQRNFETALMHLSRLPDAVREQPEAGLLEVELDLEQGRYSAVREKADAWLQRLDPVATPAHVARFLLVKATAIRNLYDPDWMALVKESVGLLQDADAPRDLAFALASQGIADYFSGNPAEANKNLMQARDVYREQGDELGAARVTATMGQLAKREGRDGEALVQLSQSVEVLEAYGAMGPLFLNLYWLAYLHMDMSHWEQALGIVDRLGRAQQGVGGATTSYERSRYLLLRIDVFRGLGRFKEAVALIDELEREARREIHENNLDDMESEELLEATIQRAQLEILQQRWDRASKTIDAGVKMWRALSGRHDSSDLRDAAERLLYLMVKGLTGPDPWSENAPLPVLAPDFMPIMRNAAGTVGVLARAHWNARHGRIVAAERDYRSVASMQKTQGASWNSLVRTAYLDYIDFLLAHGRQQDAIKTFNQLLSGFPEALEQDYDMAEASLRIRRLEGDERGARIAAQRVLKLVGERRIPDDLKPEVEAARKSKVDRQQ